MKNKYFYFIILLCIPAYINLVSCNSGGSNIEALSRLSTSANRFITDFKLDSAKLSIDSLKSIGADIAYVKAMEETIIEKRKLIENIKGSYAYSKTGVTVEIILGQNNEASLSSDLNGTTINGVNSKGSYSIVSDDEIKVIWEKAAFNKTMGDFEYDSNNKTLKIVNGTIYKKVEANAKKSTNKEDPKASSEKLTGANKQSSTKKYVMFCGQEYEAGTNFRNSLPSDYEERAGSYCLKNYHEGAESVYYSGFNKDGILVTAVGESSGEKHIILFLCNGSLY
jgi:hypothetical protein